MKETIQHCGKILFLGFALHFGNAMYAFSQVRLPSVLGDNMVLQQKDSVTLWGWAGRAEGILVTTGWDNVNYSTVTKSGATWKLKIKTPEAGGPYDIIIRGRNTIKLENIMIGEVWLCSGQSNMEWRFKDIGKDIRDELPAISNTDIRFFDMPPTSATYPQDDVKSRWVVCDTATLKHFSAVGYFFGKNLQQQLDVPIGLINASWGGTPAEVWTPAEVVMGDIRLREAAAKLKTSTTWPIQPGLTFNGMIAPITNFNIAGSIWYQGESNVYTWSTYHALFTAMIGAWREAWQKEFPFYYVALAPLAGYGREYVRALLCEQQTKTLNCPHTGMVVISDLVDDLTNTHPRNKWDVGLRLANYALSEVYKKRGIAYKSPLYKDMKVEGDKIRIYFDHADNGLKSVGRSLTEFYIAGEDQNFVRAAAKIEGNTVLVWNRAIKNPVAVRFGFRNDAIPNLFNTEGLPVNLFRTDNWLIGVDGQAQ